MMSSVTLKTRSETDRKILKVLIPVIVENGMITISSMVLAAFIGRLPLSQMNAYGLSSRIYNIYCALARGLAAAVLILLARELGRRNRAGVNHFIQESYMETVFFSAILSVVILICSRPLLSFMSSDLSLVREGAVILKETVWFYPLFALTRLNASAFHAKGITRTPMLIALAGNFVSIVSGYIWIFGIGNYAGMGVHGAAMAQNLSLCFMFLFGTYLLYGKHGLYEGAFENWKMQDFSGTGRLIEMGVPAALEDSFWQFAAVVISKIILGYGQDYYAAYQLGLQAEGFCDTMSAGFMTASLSLSAKAHGDNNRSAYTQYLKRLKVLCMYTVILTSLFLLLCARPVLNLLTDKPELVRIAAGYLFTMIFCQFPQHMQKVTNGFVKSSGYPKETMLVNLVGLWAVRIPLAFAVGKLLHLNIVFLWWVFNIDHWTRYTLLEYSFKKHGLAVLSETDK